MYNLAFLMEWKTLPLVNCYFTMLPEKFEIIYNGSKLEVHTFTLDNRTMFRVVVKSGSPPLVLARAMHRDGHKFWTSIPEGKQNLAEKIGSLIEAYYRSNFK
jgi:hypothetical protein